MWLRLRSAAVISWLGFVSVPLHAEPLPPIDKMLTQQERSLLSGVAQTDFAAGANKAKSLALLDDLLAKDPEPTQFRGFLQMMRAMALLAMSRGEDARASVDESVRLLPGYSAPLLTAFDVYAYSNRPGEAADFLLRASQVDPELVRQVSDYEINNLLRRLGSIQDRRRIQAVSARLLNIGWTGKQLGSRSALAYSAIQSRVADHDLDGARALIPELVVPGETYALLADNRYRDLWPDLERWSGPKLERQWKVYLTEARARFTASPSIENVRTYLGALRDAGDNKRIIDDVLPLLSQRFDTQRDEEWVFVVASSARAIASVGRWHDLNGIFEQAAKSWPLGSSANALNVEANHAYYLLLEGRAVDALKKIDLVLLDTQHWGSEVNVDAIAGMHFVRACSLHQLGRDSEAATSIITVVGQGDPERIVDLRLCFGDKQAAKATLIQALEREDTRSEAIHLMQKDAMPSCRSPFCERMDMAKLDLRSDPTIIAELQKYGRILPFAVNEAAGFSPSQPHDEPSKVPVT